MGLKNSVRVTWAPGPNLCQVTHFQAEDFPSKVGRGSLHLLQLKPSHLNIIKPSSEGRHCLKQSKERLPYIPWAKWKCPPKFTLNEKWRVVAGEESTEVEAQKHREKRVLEAVYPSRSAVPPNPSTLLDLDQFYDDSQTQVISIIPIEEAAALESSSQLTLPQSLSTSQNLMIPQSDCPPVKPPADKQYAPPKPPANHNPVPQYPLCQNVGIPLHQTEFSPKLPANQSLVPRYRLTCENLNIRQHKSQVSALPPANKNPVSQCPSSCKHLNLPQQQAEFSPKPQASHNPVTTPCVPTYESLNISVHKTQVSPRSSSNGSIVPQHQSMRERLSIPQQKTQVCSNPPANETSNPEIPHGFEGDLVATAAVVAALAKSQEPFSLIDTDFLIQLLSNPEQIQKLMNEHGLRAYPKTGASSGSKPIVPSSITTSSTADSLDKQIASNENGKRPDADPTIFSRSLEVRNINEQRETAAISRPVELPVPLPRKPDMVINKPINEHQVPHAGPVPIFGAKPIAKSVPLAVSKPEISVKSNVHEQGTPARIGTANIRGIKPSLPPASNVNLEKIKKMINEYGAHENAGGKPLDNSELVPSSFSKCDVVSSKLNLPIASQVKSYSPNAGNVFPFSSMTSPAPLHKGISYYKSLIKQHGENRKSPDQEIANPYGNVLRPELIQNQKSNQTGLSFQKHCIFFNSSGGCRNGSTCPFLHDVSKQWRSGGMLEAPGAKRMKLSGELTGRS